MKKRIVSFIIVLTMILTAVVPLNAMAAGIKVTLNGEQIYFDQPPVIINGRTFVPV